jgi:hypothetical protein
MRAAHLLPATKIEYEAIYIRYQTGCIPRRQADNKIYAVANS